MSFTFVEQYVGALEESKLFRDENVCKWVLLTLREICTRAEVLPCLLVCHQFNHLGSFMVYSHLVLTNSSLPLFVDCMKIRKAPRALPIKSITLRLGTQDPHIAGTDSGIHPDFNKLLFGFSEFLLRDCSKLQSLSIYIDNRAIAGQHKDPDYLELEPTFNYDAIACLLAALPKSCEYLELDTAGIEGYLEKEHLCGHIARAMRQLRHLRLRMRNLCPRFLEIPPHNTFRADQALFPKLNSLIINADVLVGTTVITKPCKYWPRPDSSLHKELVPLLHTVMGKGCVFPHLNRLQVFTQVDLGDGFGTTAVRVTDLIRNETQMLPNLRIPNYMENDPRRLTWRCIRTIGDKDVIAPRAKAMEIVEESWRSTTEGSRFPVDANIHALEIDGTYKLPLEWEKDPLPMNLRTYIDTQKNLFDANSHEHILLSKLDPSYYTSQAFLGTRELPDLFDHPIPRDYFNPGNVLQL